MKRAVVSTLALMLGGASFSAQAVPVLGGDPGVFKPHEMELLINKITGGVWIVTESPYANNAFVYGDSAHGNGWGVFGITDTLGHAILNVTQEPVDPSDPSQGTFPLYHGNIPVAQPSPPTANKPMVFLTDPTPSSLSVGIQSSSKGINFVAGNVQNPTTMALFNTGDPDPKANPFKGKLAFFLGNVFLPAGDPTFSTSEIHFEWGARTDVAGVSTSFSNVGSAPAGGQADVTFFGTPQSAVPEPATMTLLGLGGLAFLRRRATKA